MNWNGTDRRVQEAQKRADDQKWARRREDALQEKLDAVTAERDALRTPEGFMLVPIEPTEAMIKAGVEHTTLESDDEPYRARGQALCVYKDMIAASVPAALATK